MKNKLIYIYMVVGLGLLFGCKTEPILFDSSKNHVAFATSSTTVTEASSSPVGIPVVVAAELNSPQITVDFEVDTKLSVAKEGVDFTIVNSSKTLSYSAGSGYDTVWIQPKDNAVFGGNISLVLRLTSNSQSYNFGTLDSSIVTIVDDEHPLGTWIGSYEIEATYVAGFFGDEVWTGIVCSPDENDVSNLIIKGLCGTAYTDGLTVTAKVDLDKKSITIPPGADIGEHSSYGGPVSLYVGTEGNKVEEEELIVGEISDDGGIQINSLGIKFVGGTNKDLVYGVYNTKWVKK